MRLVFRPRIAHYTTLSHTKTSHQIRSAFIDFFVSNGHAPVQSASLIPQQHDASLLFTNAGMVPFKEYFRDPSLSPYSSAVSSQFCLRAGGKHNDLDNVGYTRRHHTLFEMLGNFSFGGYFRHEAIAMAWTFLTRELQLPPSKLRISVLQGDHVTRDSWKSITGLPSSHIMECGPADNFWSMGEEGPCGPCTEIFWDTGLPGEDQLLEIWNIVMMQSYRSQQGELSTLTRPCIDTGMGLERIACVLQGKEDNFDIDSFAVIIQGLMDLNPTIKMSSPHIKIVADHIRAITCLLAEGILPSNIGRGYVLRRILRRAILAGKSLGFQEPFLYQLVPSFHASLGDIPLAQDIHTKLDSIASLIKNEEVAFLSRLTKGLHLLDSALKESESRVLPASVAFQLHDTFGFPLDLTRAIARERQWSVDMQGVEKLYQEQRQRGKASWKKENKDNLNGFILEWKYVGYTSEFVGYTEDTIETTVLAVDTSGMSYKNRVIQGNDMWVLLKECPFYALGGGQAADRGTLTSGSHVWPVVDAIQPYPGAIVVCLENNGDSVLEPGQKVIARVDKDRRQRLACHHSATHLLHAALRHVLGDHVVQAGSQVSPDRLRFDFTHSSSLTPQQVTSITDRVNSFIQQDLNVSISQMQQQEAIQQGAIATFSEKYGDIVRVVRMQDASMELCGGTHVDTTRLLFPFRILSEGSIAAGIRRIEAVAGTSAVDWLLQEKHKYDQVCQLVKSDSHNVATKIEKLMSQQTLATHKMNAWLTILSEQPVDPIMNTRVSCGVQVELYNALLPLESDYYKKRMGWLLKKQPDSVCIVYSAERVAIGMSETTCKHYAIDAGKWVKNVCSEMNAKGGGKKTYAHAILPGGMTAEQVKVALITWLNTM